MGVKITDGFDAGDDEKVVSILKKFKGGPISDQLFSLVAGMMPTTGVVVVIVYKRTDPEVVFVKRPDDDPLWPNVLNLPGKLFRNADFKRSDKNPVSGPMERIQKSEIETEFPKKPEFVNVNLNSDDRGSWTSLIYIIELDNKNEYKGVGEWVKVSEMANRSDVLQTEINHINIALERTKPQL